MHISNNAFNSTFSGVDMVLIIRMQMLLIIFLNIIYLNINND